MSNKISSKRKTEIREAAANCMVNVFSYKIYKNGIKLEASVNCKDWLNSIGIIDENITDHKEELSLFNETLHRITDEMCNVLDEFHQQAFGEEQSLGEVLKEALSVFEELHSHSNNKSKTKRGGKKNG